MAEDTDQDEKTEYPTGKRLGEARDQGKLPISREVATWASFVAILSIIAWVGPHMMSNLMFTLRGFLESPDSIVLDDHSLQTVVFEAILKASLSTGLVFVLLVAAAILGIMSQTGLFASFELIKPDFARLNPLAGLKRLGSLHSLVELLKSVGKLLILGIAAYYTLRPLINEMPNFTGQPLLETLSYLHQQALHLIILLLLIFTVIAAADWFYQRYHYIKSLRMTKAEVKDEHRQQEGDPIVKARLRQIRFEKARKRMMARVPKADVVVTNPTHYAIAMQYDNQKMSAPTVIAKGIDNVALRIRELAETHKIPLVSNPPLARTLYETVEMDQEIPTQHYRAVAEIISYVYKLKKRKT